MKGLKALSVRQPHANHIADLLKTLEVRFRVTNYRGWLLICSSKVPPISPAGFAIAKTRLVDCRPMVWYDTKAAMCEFRPGQYVWELQDTEKIRPFKIRGMPGLFDVGEERKYIVPLVTAKFEDEEGKVWLVKLSTNGSMYGQKHSATFLIAEELTGDDEQDFDMAKEYEITDPTLYTPLNPMAEKVVKDVSDWMELGVVAADPLDFFVGELEKRMEHKADDKDTE